MEICTFEPIERVRLYGSTLDHIEPFVELRGKSTIDNEGFGLETNLLFNKLGSFD
jgi:hypothetical protein